MNEVFVGIEKLNADIKNAIKILNEQEIRYLVSTYYDLQEQRIGMFGRVREFNKDERPNLLYTWIANQTEVLEERIKQSLNIYVKTKEVGAWLLSLTGIGPVIAAGLMSNLDIKKGANPSSFWKYAGLAPGQERKRGQKIDYNPDLKRLCFLIGESFVKQKNRESDIYGKLYQQKKDEIILQNERGDFKDICVEILEKKKYDKKTEQHKHYSQGKLSPAHIHARARRFAVKIFLTHVWQVMYWYEFHTQPKMPWILEQPSHSRFIDVPNCPY